MVRSIRSSYRVPGEDVGRAVERIKIILELVEHTFGDGFGRPAIGGVGAADRARLRKKENLVVAHREYLSGDLDARIARQRDHEGPDLVGFELFQPLDALFLLGRIDRKSPRL